MKNGCRIARVRHKASGQTIEVISAPKRAEVGTNLVSAASTIADDRDLVAFFALGVCRDGSYLSGWQVLPDTPIGPTLLVPFISEVARREVVTDTAVTKFCVRQGWLSE